MSKIGEKILMSINPIFPKQVHPFNLQLSKEKTYAEWEYENGEKTIKFYLDKFSEEEMFKDKEVLDFGCGAGGKSVYYATLGAKHVTGIDIVKHYEKDSQEFANKMNLEDKFSFKIADATKLPFDDESFDTAIMNDFMEHVNKPEEALKEALRILKKGGRIYLNFPPYSHPFGAHLSDAINMPWCHKFFSETTCINVYKELVKNLPDGKDRISFRFSKNEDGKEYISYINKMTIKRFNKIIKSLDIKPYYYKETPFNKLVSPFAKIPCFREILNKNVVCVIQK